MKTIKAIIVITILICLCKTVVAQTSQITYGQDHLSGKLDISGVVTPLQMYIHGLLTFLKTNLSRSQELTIATCQQPHV